MTSLAAAKQRVDSLLKVQHHLRTVLSSNDSKDDSAPSDPKLSELRQLLGGAVRARAEQQHKIDELCASLQEERTAAHAAQHASMIAKQELETVRKQMQQLQKELADERSERMESEAAAMEREEELQGRVDELMEAERRRVELEKAMAEVEPPPDAPVVQVAVAPPPPAVQNAGFDASAGGFSL